MKILLLGANGQLGRTFIEHGGLALRGTLMAASRDGKVTGGAHGELADLSNPASLPALLDRLKPEVIVNAAAYTAVDRAEEDEALATRVNGEAVAALGDWAARHDALVMHYSTDYVFDGSQQIPYAVSADTSPLGAYGRSKLAGEKALRDSGAAFLMFRTAWVYAAHGNNFLRTMLRLGAEREQLSVVADQHGAPTDTTLIVNGSLAALDSWLAGGTTQRRNLTGTHHLVASGSTTWHGFAEAIFDEAIKQGLIERKPTVAAIESREFPTPAARPAWSLLDNRDFQQHFGFILPEWRQGLSAVIEALANAQH